MKKVLKLFDIIALSAIIGFTMTACGGDGNENGDPWGYDNKTWVDPATQTTQLTGGTVLLSYSGSATQLSGSPYHYTTWDYSEGKTASPNKFTWYGANQGGGGAFKAEWADYFLARLGFFWGNGGKYTQYKNIYIDYNYKRTNNASTNGGFIGVYGWSRNPSASKNVEKLIEYYIVDDWFNDPQLGPIGTEHGSFQVDGATYKIYTNIQNEEPSIDGTKTFTQIFSVRQGRRTYGTISVTEHFKAWSRYIAFGSMYEATFKVEAFGGNGNLDLTYLYLSQETNQRDIPAGTIPVDYNGGGNTGESVIVTLDSISPNGWQKSYEPASLLNGYKITSGDQLTFSYSFSSNVAMDYLQVFLVDNGLISGSNYRWEVISDYVKVQEPVTANTTYTGSVTLTATGTATDATALANRLVFGAGTGTTSQPTLTFTTLTLAKN